MRKTFSIITQAGIEQCNYKLLIKPARSLHELYHGEIQMECSFASPSERNARSCLMMCEILNFSFETCNIEVNCDNLTREGLQGYRIFLSGCLKLLVTDVPRPLRPTFRPNFVTFDCSGIAACAQGRFEGFPRTHIQNIYRQRLWSLKVHTSKGMWPSLIRLTRATRREDWKYPQILDPETRGDNIISSYVDPPWREKISYGPTAP